MQHFPARAVADACKLRCVGRRAVNRVSMNLRSKIDHLALLFYFQREILTDFLNRLVCIRRDRLGLRPCLS